MKPETGRSDVHRDAGRAVVDPGPAVDRRPIASSICSRATRSCCRPTPSRAMRRWSIAPSTACCSGAPTVIYDAMAPVHVSGHASQEEMKLLMQLIRPQYFVPIHGELRHLKQHAALAQLDRHPDRSGSPSSRTARSSSSATARCRSGSASPAVTSSSTAAGWATSGRRSCASASPWPATGLCWCNLRLNSTDRRAGRRAGDPYSRFRLRPRRRRRCSKTARQKVRELAAGDENACRNGSSVNWASSSTPRPSGGRWCWCSRRKRDRSFQLPAASYPPNRFPVSSSRSPVHHALLEWTGNRELDTGHREPNLLAAGCWRLAAGGWRL